MARLAATTMHGRNWGRAVPGPRVRDPRARGLDGLRGTVKVTSRPNAPGTWDSTVVEVFRREADADTGLVRVAEYLRDYGMLSTFEPFRQGARELALVSRTYTKTAVLDLTSGEIIAEETESTPGGGFCPVGFYVPDWWDLHDDSLIPGSESWSSDHEWPTGDFGFVWGCHWGDDTSWKVQHLDLSRVQQGIITRDDRFGYVELATRGYVAPGVAAVPGDGPSAPPDFIEVTRQAARAAPRRHERPGVATLRLAQAARVPTTPSGLRV